MATNDLLIKINADAKNAKKAFDDVKAQTEDLENQLKDVALISGAAFAALTVTVGYCVNAFIGAKASTDELTTALQNQGIYTPQLAQSYADLATAIERKTGVDADDIQSSMASAQSMIGQIEITEELTQAVVDFAAAQKMEMGAAFDLVAKGINGNVAGFRKMGISLDENASKQERLAAITEQLGQRFGGQATAAQQAKGGIDILNHAFGDVAEGIGERFYPIFTQVTSALTKAFQFIADNPVILDLATAFIAAGIAVSGMAAAVAVAVPIFTALTAAAAAFGVALNVAFVGIPVLIGAVVAGITLLALNWDKSMAFIRSTATGVVTFLTELFGGLGKLLEGVFTFDVAKIDAGLERVKGSFAKAKDEATTSFQEITAAQAEEQTKQDETKLAAANKAAADERQHQANLRAIRTAEMELLRLQNENASQALIAIKTKEIEVLKALDQEKTATELALLRDKHAQILALQDEQRAVDAERAAAFAQLQEDTRAELEQKRIEADTALTDQQINQLRATALTEIDIDRQVQTEILNRRIAARNQELLDRKKYGETVARLNQIMYSDEVQNAKSAASDLVALTQSKNEQLKAIGKVAAIAQITITTPEAAMKAYNSLVGIPFVGPALAVTAAAATVAYGAERIGEVTAAADGGLIEGGVPGRDSVPALLMPGELVVPRRNFNDVVGAVQGRTQNTDNTEVLAALQSIDDKIGNVQNPIVIQGDVTTDQNYIDALVKQISDAIEFRNAKLFGVNT